LPEEIRGEFCALRSDLKNLTVVIEDVVGNTHFAMSQEAASDMGRRILELFIKISRAES
jgi:hypothetical protein